MKIKLTNVLVDNLDKALKFYTEVLRDTNRKPRQEKSLLRKEKMKIE